MNENDNDDQPKIDMTSQEDQRFMDANAEPEEFDRWAHYRDKVEEFEENGWDTSVLKPPEEDKEGNKQQKAQEPFDKPAHARDDKDMTDLSDLKQKLTPRGQEILESTIEERGEEWVAEHEELILAQAKKVGMTE